MNAACLHPVPCILALHHVDAVLSKTMKLCASVGKRVDFLQFTEISCAVSDNKFIRC